MYFESFVYNVKMSFLDCVLIQQTRHVPPLAVFVGFEQIQDKIVSGL